MKKAKMADHASLGGLSDDFITLSRGRDEERVDRKIRKSQVNTERLSVMSGVS